MSCLLTKYYLFFYLSSSPKTKYLIIAREVTRNRIYLASGLTLLLLSMKNSKFMKLSMIKAIAAKY
ncbi:MAG: hypothetical protein ACOC1O_00620 [bacterium]